ncbi:hypothetical protein BKD03_15220 [Brucella sp. 09RB8471]|nr:hypothetical protein BKD03_15220 [Brucella sp. 09RB8471]
MGSLIIFSSGILAATITVEAAGAWVQSSVPAHLRGRVRSHLPCARAFSSQKCEAPTRGNQSIGLISDPASMRRIMRRNKEIERFQRFC